MQALAHLGHDDNPTSTKCDCKMKRRKIGEVSFLSTGAGNKTLDTNQKLNLLK